MITKAMPSAISANIELYRRNVSILNCDKKLSYRSAPKMISAISVATTHILARSIVERGASEPRNDSRAANGLNASPALRSLLNEHGNDDHGGLDQERGGIGYAIG